MNLCGICNKFVASEEVPEIEKKICKLCKIEKETNLIKRENFTYYPPVTMRKINVFDDGNQKYENEPNEWLKIGHDISHPEKIVLVNNITKNIISSISIWKVSEK